MTIIRPITDDDVDTVADIHVRTWQAAYAGIVPGDVLDRLDPTQFAAARRTRREPPGATTLVAIDAAITGFASAGPYRKGDDGELGELYALYVDPGRWGSGAGRALFTAAADHLRGTGCTRMWVWVLEENHPGRRFYEHMGMWPDGARDSYTPRGSTVHLPEVRYITRL